MNSYLIDPTLRDSVTGLVSALGGINFADPTHPYELGDDALGCLKDLKKWVKFYGSIGKLDALRCIADTNLVSLDICQILGRFREGQENDQVKWRLALNCLELLVQLTWQIEIDPHQTDLVQCIYETPLKAAQISYKNAILHHSEYNILRPIVRIALPSLAVSRRDRSERDDNIIILVIALLRNLVEISSRNVRSAGMDKEKTDYSRSETILAFERSDVFNLISALAAGTLDEYEKVDCLLLEILYHLLKGVNIEDLVSTVHVRSKPLNDLSNMLRREDSVKRQSKRFSSTRHNRFGTMISVVAGNDLRLTVHGQSALKDDPSQSLEKLDAVKKYIKPVRHSDVNDLDKPVQLTNEARSVLNNFVKSFIEASFNPLFLSVTRAIEREASRCCDVHRTQLLYLIGWFLKLHLLHHSKGPKKAEDIDYGDLASVFDPRCLVLVLRIMHHASAHRNWTELHAAMECFEELKLKAVHTMSLSKSEEDNEIATNILLNLFYDENHLELIVSNVRSYKHQSFGFLDACTSLANTVLKVLEQFSQDRRIYIKSKRQQTKSNNKKEHGEDSDSEEERMIVKKVAEKAFQFTSFESKFVNHHCIDTFRSLLDFYAELTPDRIKRVLVFFHRIFVKRKQQVILYRLDICELLLRMINDEVNIPRDSSIRKHLEDFVKHYTYSLTKALKTSPALYVELLFSKISTTVYYLQHGEDEPAPPPTRPRAAAEFEVRPGRNHEDQLAVVVASLLDDQKSEALDSMKKVFGNAITEMRAWELAAEARGITNDGNEGPDNHTIMLTFGDESLKTAVFKDGKLQLLLRLMGAERFGERDDPDAIWEIPSSVTTDDLETNIRLLKQYVDEPPVFEDGKSAANLLRRKTVRKESYSDTDESSVSDSNDEESSDKRHRSKKKRKRRELDDEEIEARREKRRLADLAKRALIKSAVRIVDSDDDSDAEREFFMKEAELRERMAKKAMDGELSGPGTKKARVKKTRKIHVEPEVFDLNNDDEESMDLDILSPASDRLTSSVSLDDDSEHNMGRVKPSKKRKIRRAIGISSDED